MKEEKETQKKDREKEKESQKKDRKKSATGLRSRWCQLVLYPESQQAEIDYIVNTWPCAWILHDKDVNEDGTPKKAHVHILCQFPNARYFTGVAKEAGVPVHQIERVDAPAAAYDYLDHSNAEDKHRYSHEEVHHHNFDPDRVDSKSGELSELDQVEILLGMPLISSPRERAAWAAANGCWSAYRRAYGLWKDIHAYDVMIEEQRKADLQTAMSEEDNGQFRMVENKRRRHAGR